VVVCTSDWLNVGVIGVLGVDAVLLPLPPPPHAVKTKVHRIGITYLTGAPVVIDNLIIAY
jgi:hypothetical protein